MAELTKGAWSTKNTAPCESSTVYGTLSEDKCNSRYFMKRSVACMNFEESGKIAAHHMQARGRLSNRFSEAPRQPC
jgi:hypothetical protein